MAGGGKIIKDATATPEKVFEGEIFYNNAGRQMGTFSMADATATPADVARGKTFYTGAGKQTGARNSGTQILKTVRFSSVIELTTGMSTTDLPLKKIVNTNKEEVTSSNMSDGDVGITTPINAGYIGPSYTYLLTTVPLNIPADSLHKIEHIESHQMGHSDTLYTPYYPDLGTYAAPFGYVTSNISGSSGGGSNSYYKFNVTGDTLKSVDIYTGDTVFGRSNQITFNFWGSK